jgi:hypothetical protein
MNIVERCEACNKIMGIKRDPQLGAEMFCDSCHGEEYIHFIPMARRVDAYLFNGKDKEPTMLPVVAVATTRDELPEMLAFLHGGEVFDPTILADFMGYYADGAKPSPEDMMYALRRHEAGVHLCLPKDQRKVEELA